MAAKRFDDMTEEERRAAMADLDAQIRVGTKKRFEASRRLSRGLEDGLSPSDG